MMPVRVRRHARRAPARSELRFEPGVSGRMGAVEGTRDVYLGKIPVAQYRYQFITPTSAEINWVGVRGDYQGQGVGRLVVEKILDDLRQQGVQLVYLDSTPYAYPFWEHMGFRPVDREQEETGEIYSINRMVMFL